MTELSSGDQAQKRRRNYITKFTVWFVLILVTLPALFLVPGKLWNVVLIWWLVLIVGGGLYLSYVNPVRRKV